MSRKKVWIKGQNKKKVCITLFAKNHPLHRETTPKIPRFCQTQVEAMEVI